MDDVASDWVGRLKGLLRLGAFTDRDPTTTDGLMGAPSGSSFSSADDSPSSFDFAKDSSEPQKQQKQQQFRVNDDNHYLAFSLYRWYSSLSLKLSWLQTSHKTVIDNLLLFQRIPRTWHLSTRQWNAYTDLNLICIRPKDCLTWYLFVFEILMSMCVGMEIQFETFFICLPPSTSRKFLWWNVLLFLFPLHLFLSSLVI